MTISHKFHTPRNMFEKLVRDYEQLDIRVSGDNMYNFISTAYHLQEWIKNAPLHGTEQGKRLAKKASHENCIRLCKQILSSKKTFRIEIDDPSLEPGVEPDFESKPKIKDLVHYKKGTKKFKWIVDETEEIDPFEFKEEVLNTYKTYFHIK